MPKKTTRRKLINRLSRTVRKNDPSVELDLSNAKKVDAPEVIYTQEGKKYVWDIGSDNSIEASKGYEGIEFRSPILRNTGDRELHYKMIDELKAAGVRSSPQTAGVHVHVGFPNAQPEELNLLYSLFSSVERELYRKFNIVDQRIRWANFTDAEIPEHVKNVKKANAKLETSKVIEKSGGKYRGINFLTLTNLKTVEFRLFNSTLDSKKVRYMVEFATGLVKGVRSKSPKLKKLLEHHPKDKTLPLDELLEALDIKIDFKRFETLQ